MKTGVYLLIWQKQILAKLFSSWISGEFRSNHPLLSREAETFFRGLPNHPLFVFAKICGRGGGDLDATPLIHTLEKKCCQKCNFHFASFCYGRSIYNLNTMLVKKLESKIKKVLCYFWKVDQKWTGGDFTFLQKNKNPMFFFFDVWRKKTYVFMYIFLRQIYFLKASIKWSI